MTDQTLTLSLSTGDVVIRLRPDLAPLHVERITQLASEGFYDGVVFHRVIPGFMAQGGDPTGTGMGGSPMPDLHPMQPSAYEVWHVMGLGAAPATTGELGVLHHILGLALSIDNGRGVVNTGGRINTLYLAGVWQNYKATGGYRLPAGHVNWTEAELINWLRMLQYPIPLHQV